MSEKEDERFRKVLDQLKEDGKIDNGKWTAIYAVIDDRRKKIADRIDGLYSGKHMEVKTKSDDLTEKLNAIQNQVGI